MSESGSTAPARPATFGSKLARLGRFILFLCTAGWAYPHVCTEGMELTKIQNDHINKKR